MATVNEKMTAIADAIRKQTYNSEKLTLDDMAKQILLVAGNNYDRGHMDGYFQRVGEEEGLTESRKAILDEAMLSTTGSFDESIEGAARAIREVLVFLDNSCNIFPEDVANNGFLSTLVTAFNTASTVYYARGETAGIEQGKKSAYDEFWDSFQQNGNLTYMTQLFGGYGWNDTTFKPKYDMNPTDANTMFMRARITDLKAILDAQGVTLNFYNCGSLYGAFSYSTITHIGTIDVSQHHKYTNMNATFQECTKLVTIDNIKLSGSYYHNISDTTFQNCTSLKNISFTNNIYGSINFKWSPLSKDSITNIVEHLHPTQTGFTITLKKTAVNEAFGIDVDDETTYPEGSEYYILRHSRDNWTFTYA